MLASWCLLEEVMILSESSEKVVWELNELLAAQQRARNFSRATLNGEIDTRSNQFVPQSWDVLPEALKLMETLPLNQRLRKRMQMNMQPPTTKIRRQRRSFKRQRH